MNMQKSFRLLVTVTVFLFCGSLAAAPARSEAPRVAGRTAEAGTAVGDKVLAKWTCIRPGPTAVDFDFKLTGEGQVYQIHFTKGLEDPYAIRAAIHAVLSGMPYQHSKSPSGITNVHCSIRGDRSKPKITATLSPAPNDLSVDDLSGIKRVSKYKHQLFIHGPMALRLIDLCEHLFFHPDSNVTIGEVKKICSYVGLDTRVAHDWVGISRFGNQSLVIMRHPSKNTTQYVRASIGALSQAWKISPDRNILCALEEAWVKHAAIEVLASSKADPLMLASASVLTGQFKMAKEQYRIAIRERNPKAALALSQMNQVSTDKFVKPVTLDSRYKPAGSASDWKTILRWIPTDIELMISGSVNTSGKQIKTQMPLFGDLIIALSPDVLHSMEFRRKPFLLQNNKLFEGVTEVNCIHAARNFKTPRGGFIGLGSSDNVEIMVLPQAQQHIASKAISILRTKCDEKDILEGMEVLGFEEFPFSFGVTSLGAKQYLVQPCSGVLVAATDKGILRELLIRLRSQPDDRALPDSLREWKYVDTAAPVWAVRHYDQAYVPFDSSGMYNIVTASFERPESATGADAPVPREIGMTFSSRGDKITIHHLSNNLQTLKGLRKSYEHVFNYNPMMPQQAKVPKSKSLESYSLKDNVLAVEGTVREYSVIRIQLFISMGYFVAI